MAGTPTKRGSGRGAKAPASSRARSAKEPAVQPPAPAPEGDRASLRLGEFLREAGTITEEELTEALLTQRKTGRKLGAILVDMGLLSEEELCEELSKRLGIPYFDLSSWVIDPKVVQLVPEHLCERYRLIALKKAASRLTVAMINPFDEMALEDLAILTGLQIRPVLATPSAISRALAQAYGAIDFAASIVESLANASGTIDLKKRLYRMIADHEARRENDPDESGEYGGEGPREVGRKDDDDEGGSKS